MRDLRDLPRLVERPRKKKATLVEFGEVKRLPSDRPVLLDLHQHVGCAQWRRPCGPCIGDQSYRGPDAFNQVPRVCALGLLLPFFCCRRRRGCFCRPSTTLLTFVPYHCVRLVCCCRRHGTACNIAAFSLQHPTGYLERQREDPNHGGSEPDLGPFFFLSLLLQQNLFTFTVSIRPPCPPMARSAFLMQGITYYHNGAKDDYGRSRASPPRAPLPFLF